LNYADLLVCEDGIEPPYPEGRELQSRTAAKCCDSQL